MKKILSFCLLVGVFFMGSCNDTLLEHQSSFEKSQRAWLDFKHASNNSYTYTATGASWTGGSWSTVITVDRGEVIRRSFSYTVFQDIKRPATGWDEASRNTVLANLGLTADEFEEVSGKRLEEVLEWQEEGEMLGSHEGTGAAEPITLDEVYALSASDWLVRRDNRQAIFEATNNGMISVSGFLLDNCQDDCFKGITIVEIASY
ncbi:MAG: hypothetical protein JJU34_12810 [Lunatimonas sp.]|uniref:hypothetical protein n=1 Tax=Lunatimonas sp. TaxID=2060141 RepID=UPI00263AA031|nr:hypothetical protein [Lunatimonas sp.]MCC5938153.1 hypothetical protein [Lunatimonas sp.]